MLIEALRVKSRYKYQNIKTQKSWLYNSKSDTIKHLQKFLKFHFNKLINLTPNSVFSLVDTTKQ